ncbi:hypothetical protein COOONC_15440, partial [Cooperia oncophora]
MAQEELLPNIPIYAQPSRLRQCTTENGGGSVEERFSTTKRLSVVGDISHAEHGASERVYDVAYCAGLLTLSMPGTVTGVDRSDTIYSTMSHQLLKRVDAPKKRKVQADKRLSRESRSLPSNRHSGELASDADPMEPSGYSYLGYQRYKRERQSGIRELPIISVSQLSLSVDIRKNWERLLLRMPKRRYLLQGISFNLNGGDIFAIMYTS